MKMKKMIGISLMSILALASCQQKDCPLSQHDKDQMIGRSVVSFKTNIMPAALRAHDNVWEKGDNIGVYMLKSGAVLGTAQPEEILYANKVYSTQTDGEKGIFNPVSDGDKMYMPSDGSGVDFVSFYPQNQKVENYKIDVDIAAKPTLDILYTNSLKNVSKNSPASDLVMGFHHVLSQVRLILTDEAGKAVEPTEISLLGLNTKAKLQLADGRLIEKGQKKSIAMSKDKDGRFYACVIPTENTANVKVQIKAFSKTYTWAIPAKELVEGKRYTYQLQLLKGGDLKWINFEGNTITDWADVDGGKYTLNPDADEDLTLDQTELIFAATDNGDTGAKTVNVTTKKDWAIELKGTDADKFEISPMNGSGNGSFVVKAKAANTTAVEYSATAVIKAGTKTVDVSIKQNAAQPAIGNLLFPGSDFEDWNAFLSSLNSFGLHKLGSMASDGGREGSKALHLKGTDAGNSFLFTAVVPATGNSMKGKSKVIFYIKGTAGKSLSLCVYEDGNKKYKSYNLGANSGEDVVLVVADKNDYIGTIDTKGKWVKVSLDISALSQFSESGNMFAIKFGKSADYDLYIDDITVE
ncbi:fimbrillin family protein [Porphyromonas macacae]|uniref:fimbrillin family protein n=1 Tax=Porphyromonas macacae TaxID=28115 RepID=UPI00359FED12